jgi:hypothetical protein
MPGDQPTNLILAADGTEVSLARESEKKCFLNYGRKKESKFGTEVEFIIKLHATKKSLMNGGSPDIEMVPSDVFIFIK